MKTDVPLDTRIAAAFGTGVKSEAVSQLSSETEAAALSAGELAQRARERALDPTISPAQLEAARKQSEDAIFNRERMNAAVVRLRKRLLDLSNTQTVNGPPDQSSFIPDEGPRNWTPELKLLPQCTAYADRPAAISLRSRSRRRYAARSRSRPASLARRPRNMPKTAASAG